MTVTRDLAKTSGTTMVSPFEDIERLFEEVWMRPTSLFGAFLPEHRLTETRGLSPSIDIYEEGGDLVLKADVPGITRDDLRLEVVGTTLTISGEKKKEEKIEREKYYRYERSHGSFCRSFELPEGSDTDKMKAHFENGVLEVRIPKPESISETVKRIPIR